MSRKKGVDTQIGVTRGFVTEYTPVAFPREAAIDIDNVILDADGSARRRPGVDLEQSYQANSINGAVLGEGALTTNAFTTHLWEFVSNSGTLNIIVQQMGEFLHFYAQFGAISQNLLGTLDLSPFAVDLSLLRKAQIQVASGLGNLYIVNAHCEPLRVSYSGNAFTAQPINIRIRDLDGLDDTLAVDERPVSMTRNHYYNLRNQGWTDVNLRTFGGVDAGANLCALSGNVGGAVADVNWPSNSDNMNIGIVTNSDGNLVFDPAFIRNDNFGNTPQAKGHFILNAFNPSYDDVLDCPGTGEGDFPNRPESVVFHQGRAFYTTPNVQNVVGGVYYSQQLVRPELDGDCFQEADPTAGEINDLIDTDGGFLPMPGVGQIYALKEVGNGIAAIASNGVWFLTGGDIGSGITATNLRLDKVSKSGALGPRSIVEAEGSIFYFGIEGIMQLSMGDIGLSASNISMDSIQTFYISIAADSRRDAAAVYIPEARKLYWSYREAATESPSMIAHNRFLVLDFDIKGYYKYSIAEQAGHPFPEIVGLTLIKPLSSGVANLPILEIDGTNVTELDDSAVTEDVTQETGQITQLKCACLVYSSADAGWKITFATFHSRAFTDWKDNHPTGAGIPMSSYIEFAEFQMGGHTTKGVANYVHSFFQKSSKNLAPGGYWELPPLYYMSTGLRLGQSVIEVLNKPSSNLRLSQSVVEVLLTSPSDFRMSQSVVEVLHNA
tara:strand:+ start:1433 stop:3598 length:2166 start_codon:yes stop_codon:yes gene_type:complete